MIRQLVLAACFVAFVFSACVTIGPAVGGLCPTGYTVVTNNGNQECADAANASQCTSDGTCKDINPNCESWKKNGFCTSAFYTAAQKKSSCAKACALC